MRTKIAIAALAAMLSSPALAQDAFVVGITAALTGPPASTYAPAMEALRIYIDRVNAAGGVNGKKINLVLLDDSAEPSKAAANMKRLTTQENAVLVINASLSSTYAPTIGEAKRASIPLLFASGVCPKEVYPPADPLQFCTTAYAANFDSRGALTFIKEKAKGDVTLGLAAMAIPLSRGEMEYAQKIAPEFGFKVATLEVIPPPTPDYTPFATKIKDAGATWMFSWAPWVTQVRTLEALRRLDWQGDYLTWAHLEAEGELLRLKDARLNVIGANSLYQDNLPIHQEIRQAVKKAGAKYPAEQMSEGWIAGMVIEAAMRGVKGDPTPAKVQESMSNLKVDLKGLRGGPIEWTKDNHFRTRQFYRVYRWDPAKNAIAVAKDWYAYDVK